jgi:hypothetical protein
MCERKIGVEVQSKGVYKGRHKVDNIYIGLLVYTGGGWWLDEPVLRQTVYAFK